MTRQQKGEACKHVVNVVLDILNAKPIAKALANNCYKKIDQLMDLTDNTISSLTYVTNNTNTNMLNLAEHETLYAFQILMKTKTDRNVDRPRTIAEWKDLTNADFDTFCISKIYPYHVSVNVVFAALGQDPSFVRNPFEDSKKATKCHPKQRSGTDSNRK
jgi:hypothetical protein